MSLARARLAVKQQDAGLRRRGALTGDGVEQLVEPGTGLGMHCLDVDRIGAPDVVLPRDRMLERSRKLVGVGRHVVLWRHLP